MQNDPQERFEDTTQGPDPQPPLRSPTQEPRQRPSPKQPSIKRGPQTPHKSPTPQASTNNAHRGTSDHHKNNGQGQRHHHCTHNFAQNPLLTPTKHPHNHHHQNSLPSQPKDIFLTYQIQLHLPRGQHTYIYTRNPKSTQSLDHSHKPYPTSQPWKHITQRLST